ncbi:MAG: fusaric acid resistance protein [Burkholderia sp.]|nr:fusaric acid resistance protein [Burkholderia sp.]
MKLSVFPIADRAVLVLALALAGCASDHGLRPRASLQNGDTLAASAALASTKLSPAAWPANDWWRRYGDAQLDGLVAEALAGSPSMRVADARIRQASAYAGLAESALAPQVSGGLKSNRQRYSANSTTPKPLAGSWATSNEARLNFSYELDFWGRNQAGLDAALGRFHAAKVDAQAARLMIVVGVTQSYLRLSQSFAQLELAEAVLHQRTHVLALTRQRVIAKIDSDIDLKQAELAIPLARQQIAESKESIAQLRAQLAALTGAGPDRGDRISRPKLDGLLPASIPSVLPSELLARRPDVVAQRWRVEALSHDIAAAKAQFYPTVNMTALVGLQSLGFGNFLMGSSAISGAGGALSLPIFDGGRLRDNLAVRNADYDIAVEQYNQTIADALRDVVSQLVAISALKERAALQDEALTTARQAYALSTQRYRSGLGNYLQVLATESQVLALERAQIELDARAFDLDLNLARALGGGVQAAPELVGASSTHPHQGE